jgi:DNA-binding response OmpR family regulator
MKLLVVEDDDRLRALLVRRLKGTGFAVVGLATAAEAWDALREGRFDLIVLDPGLPDHDGTALVEQLRREQDTTPVILVSGRTSWRDRVVGLEAGADDYLSKPFSFEELLARIHTRLRRPAADHDTIVGLEQTAPAVCRPVSRRRPRSTRRESGS